METASAGKGGLLASEQWARPHIAIARNRWREGHVESNYYRFSPAAGVNASINDMTRWLQAMLLEFPTVVPEDVIVDVTTPRVKTTREVYRRGWRDKLTDAHYGFGWRIYDYAGETLNYHGGWVKNPTSLTPQPLTSGEPIFRKRNASNSKQPAWEINGKRARRPLPQ